MKLKLQVPGSRPLADFLPTLTIKAKDFATELIDRGVKPEQLPPAEDLKKVRRRLDGDEKKVIKDAKYGKK